MSSITRPFDRRTFLAGLGAAIALGACSDDQTDLEADTPVAPATTGPIDTTAPEDIEPVAPIEAPPVDLTVDPFDSGVASGDPTQSSVVLWTRLFGSDLAEELPLVWEVATTSDFDVLVATGRTRVRAEDAHTTRSVVADLPSGRIFWYRFRVGSFTSPVGRTRTLPGPGDRVDRLRLAVSSCQRFENGHYAAHRDIAEADVDLVVWLGDFIYDSAGSSAIEGRTPRGGAATTLADYRDRYAQYRSDPLLQAAQAAHPWVSTWDDHEVRNDYDASIGRQRRAAAYRAWWEHTPTALPAPDANGLRIHRTVDYGDLARICLVDVRQYADGTTLLGAEQLDWLVEELDNDHRMTILASPVLFGSLVGSVGGANLLPYAWDAYPDERDEVARRLAERDSMILSGDLHTSMVLDVQVDAPARGTVTAATEFMAPAISSVFPAAFEPVAPLLPKLNPQVRHIDVANGWLLVDIEEAATTLEFRFVDDIEDPASTMTVGRRYQLDPGDRFAREL